jgi:hypothetical protein
MGHGGCLARYRFIAATQPVQGGKLTFELKIPAVRYESLPERISPFTMVGNH